MRHRVCVVGAGVVGLSTALRCAQVLAPDYQVTIVAAQFGQQLVSDIAGGSFRMTNAPEVSGYRGKRTSVGKYDSNL